MKNVKMVLTALAVFAVVGGALAFKTKTFFTSSFCASTTQNVGCSVIIDKTIVNGTANFFYNANWDGIPGDCTPTNCPTAVRLIWD